MLTLLFNWRVWAAVGVSVLLASTHWKAYVSGKRTIQAEFTAYVAEEKVLLAAATETARLRERSINTTLRQSYDQYNTLKSSIRADAKSASSQLQQLEATVTATPGCSDPSTPGGVDATTPFRELLLACTKSLSELAEEADEIAARLQGLQGYVRSIK